MLVVRLRHCFEVRTPSHETFYRDIYDEEKRSHTLRLRTDNDYLVSDSVSTHYDMYIYISTRGHEITTPCGAVVTVKFVFTVSKRAVDHM